MVAGEAAVLAENREASPPRRCASSACTVLRSQMHRYDRNCTFAADFIANTAALAVQMMRNRYDERRVLDEIHKYRSWDLSKGNWQKVKGRVLDRVAQALHPHTHTTQHRARVRTSPMTIPISTRRPSALGSPLWPDACSRRDLSFL